MTSNLLPPLDLGDRLLWADGVSSVTPAHLPDAMLKLAGTGKLAITELTLDVISFNEVSDQPIIIKTEVDLTKFPPAWVLPERYKYINLDEYLFGLADRIERDDLYEERLLRLSEEISLFKELKLDDVLRALIFTVETMVDKNVVWGVGRGSSCSSYLLYLLGLHEVDPVKYDILITDFIKSQET